MRRALARAGALVSGALVVALTLAAPAAATPGPTSAPEYWFDNWHVTQLWNSGALGQGITIAEIDTGVNASLPELAGRVLSGKDFGPAGGNGQVDREVDAFGHGTAMASIMVGRPGIFGITGLAPDARVLPIAVPLTGTTDSQPDDHLASAIRWAADHGAKVISMSLGGTRYPADGTQPCPADEQQAVFHALRKGAVLLASAGNKGRSGSPVEEPGVCLGVLSVGAVDASGTVAGFSSRHPYLMMSAPGVNIASLSRVPGMAYSGDGTSQATAIASAVLALAWSRYPTDTGAQIVARLLDTLDRHRETRDPAYGYGIVDGYTAVTAPVPPSAPNPVYAAAAPFLARDTAFLDPPKLRAPAVAATPGQHTGSFAVGSAPRLLVPDVLAGLGVALAGLLALVALGAAARVSRRRRPAAAEPAPAYPGADPGYPGG